MASGLVGELSHRRSQLVNDISKAQTGLTKSAAASRAAADMLAAPGQYLLVAANNAEMRDGQGIVLHSTMMAIIGGALSLESAPGHGSRVTLSIPLPTT